MAQTDSTTMSASLPPLPLADPRAPRYEMRVSINNSADWRLELWQLPAPSTPRIKFPTYMAGLHGQPLRTLEYRILKQLARQAIVIGSLRPGKKRAWPVTEDDALPWALLFRILAPMRNIDRIRQVADGIEAMSTQEAAYWYGMTLYRKKPQRVLAALRMLLTTP